MKDEIKNNAVEIVNNIINSTDDLVKIIRSTKTNDIEILQVIDNIILFMDAIIKIFPDILIIDNQPSPRQKLYKSFVNKKNAWEKFSHNPIQFFLEWHNFKLQWHNYYINLKYIENHDTSFFISLN